MTHSSRLPIEIVGVTGIEVMEDGCKVSSGSLQKQVVVVGHQAEAVDSGSVAFRARIEVGKEFLVVGSGPEDCFPLIPSGGDVVEGTGVFNPQRSSHDQTLSRLPGPVKSVECRPDTVVPLPEIGPEAILIPVMGGVSSSTKRSTDV